MRTLKKYMFLLFLLLTGPLSNAQLFEVMFVDDFEPGGAFSVIDTFAPAGVNRWTINDEYSGQGINPDVPSQDSTVGNIGQIGTPNGYYLHIYDVTSPVSNASYLATSASDSWVLMTSGYCTYGFTRIVLNYWWTGSGSPADYGRVYYSIDGGTNWNITTNWSNDSAHGGIDKWKFEKIEDAAFLNVEDLRFAFRWNNDAVDLGDTLPFAIDDVMLVAYYDSVTASVDAIDFNPNPICHEFPDTITLLIDFLDPLCPGTYFIEFSDSAGDFTNSTLIGIFELDDAWTGFVGLVNLSGVLPLPTTLPLGTCYKYRIRRSTPPIFIGAASTICIVIGNCPDSIVTLQPGVTKGSPQRPVCISSIIDVPFYSYGAYNPANTYTLQLSDEFGSFNNPSILSGPSPDDQLYDPVLYPPPVTPGSMSGQIPVVPEGCNYYVRVIASDPIVDSLPPPTSSTQYSVPWGPFCIIECAGSGGGSGSGGGGGGGSGGGGGVPQGGTSYSVCITNADSACIEISPTNPAVYDTLLSYQLILQLFDKQTMTLISQGDLQATWDSINQILTICVPNLIDYLAIGGLELKGYYMNIMAVSGVDSMNIFGYVNLSINGVSGEPLFVTATPDSIFCGDNTFVVATVSGNFPPTSKFIWYFNGFASQPIGPGVSYNLDGLSSGIYPITVQELTPGGDISCMGPMSDTAYVYVDLLPDVTINGPNPVCPGEITTYSANFESSTYYEWSLFDPLGIATIIDTANNQITIQWSSTIVGSATINLFACNECDGDVMQCDNNSITVTIQKNSEVLVVPDPVTICEGDSVTLVGSNLTWPINNAYMWSLDGDTLRNVFVPFGPDSIKVAPLKSVKYYLKIQNNCPDSDTIVITVIPKLQDAKICRDDSVQIFATGATSYQWTPGGELSDSTAQNPIAFPQNTTIYTLTFDSNCTHTLTVRVDTAIADAGDDKEIFRGDEVTLSGTGGVTYNWTPTTGLDNPNIANPNASPDITTVYTVSIIDGNGCRAEDTVTVRVVLLEVPDAFTPNGDGVNDILYVYNILGKQLDVTGEPIESFEFKIFNRWGEVIYESKDLNKGWNGKHYKTERDMEIGVYVWLITAKTADGESIGPISGNVSLIK